MELPQQCSKSKVHLTLHPSSVLPFPEGLQDFRSSFGVSYLAYPPTLTYQSTDVEGPPRVGPALGETHPPPLTSSPLQGQDSVLVTSAWTEQGPVQESKKQRSTVICYPKSFVIKRKNATNHL